MNKILTYGLLVFSSIVVFYTLPKEKITQSTINSSSTSKLKPQEKNLISKKNEVTTKILEVKGSVQNNLTKVSKQARLNDDEEFLDKEKLVLNELAILKIMTGDERAEYYKEKELNHVVGNEIASNDSATKTSYDAVILSRMTEGDINEYYNKKELKNMNILEIDNNYAVDIPYSALNPTE